MKIKNRQTKLTEYREAHPDLEKDPEIRLRKYFESNGLNLEKACKKAQVKLDKILSQREYKTISITMYEYPMKTDRPRHTKFGRTYSPNAKDNYLYFENAVKTIKKEFKLVNTPASILIEAYLEMPKRVPPDEVILYEAKVLNVEDTPDYDNIGKCYTDILKNNLIIDDDIFYEGTVKKFYSLLPRVEITITYLATHESEYVYKRLKSRKSVKEAIKDGSVVLTKLYEKD